MDTLLLGFRFVTWATNGRQRLIHVVRQSERMTLCRGILPAGDGEVSWGPSVNLPVCKVCLKRRQCLLLTYMTGNR